MENKKGKNQGLLYCNFFPKNNNAQITIFIIFLLVLIFAAGLYFFINRGVQNESEAQRTTDPLYVYVQECIKGALFDSAKLFGLQQGYHIVPRASLETSFYRIAYYYLRGESLIPANEFFEEEFSKIASDEIAKECSDFSAFKEQGYAIKSNSPIVKTKISPDNLKINVNYLIFISTNKTSYEISEFDYEVPVRIGHIIDVSRAIVEEIKKEPHAIDMTFLLNQDVDVSVQNYDECNRVYLMLDNESKTNDGESYVYSFAVGFSEEYCANENSA